MPSMSSLRLRRRKSQYQLLLKLRLVRRRRRRRRFLGGYCLRYGSTLIGRLCPPLRTCHVCLTVDVYRKFFTFIVTLNAIGIGLAASGRWTYALRYPGAILLGNLFCAILMRNELFGRFLYWFVNTFFAKWPPLWFRLGCTSVLQVGDDLSMKFYDADEEFLASWWNPQWLCTFRTGMVNFARCQYLPPA